MCDAHMSDPVPLHEADLARPFTYDRKWGVFYVPPGYHYVAASLLLAFHHDLETVTDAWDKFNVKDSYETSDIWLDTIPGTAFRSSVSEKVRAGRKNNLTTMEKRILSKAGILTFVFEEQ